MQLVHLPYFLHNFWRKIFLTLYYINWSNFIAWLLLLLEMLGNMCIITGCFPSCNSANFEINLRFLITSFSGMTKTVKTKLWISYEQKELLRWKRTFFTNFKGISLKQIKQTFSEGEGLTLSYMEVFAKILIFVVLKCLMNKTKY